MSIPHSIPASLALALIAFTINSIVFADTPATQPAASALPPPVKLTSEQDPRRIMQLLGLTSLDGDIAFRQHPGGHTDACNWPTFLKFADRYIEGPPVASTQPTADTR